MKQKGLLVGSFDFNPLETKGHKSGLDSNVFVISERYQKYEKKILIYFYHMSLH